MGQNEGVGDRKFSIESLRRKVEGLKSETHALVLAARHPRTPWHAKALAVFIVAYAVSPIDLIPDFIPVVGYLDDLVIIPAGIGLLIRIIPGDVLQECREKARSEPISLRKNWVMGAGVILIWLLLVYLGLRLLWRALNG